MSDPSVRLRRKYYQGLPRNGAVCAICGRPPGKIKLSGDHSHDVDKVKVLVDRWSDNPDGYAWVAKANYRGRPVCYFGATRKDAWKAVKIALFKMAFRGFLCMRCNKGISFFEDLKAPIPPAPRLLRASHYLGQFNERFTETRPSAP